MPPPNLSCGRACGVVQTQGHTGVEHNPVREIVIDRSKPLVTVADAVLRRARDFDRTYAEQ